MFGMVLEKLMIVDMQKISGTVERKITAVGVTKILCECPQMIDGHYARLWFVSVLILKSIINQGKKI